MAKRKKSRGRDLKHTETQAAVNVSRIVTRERGRTNGVEKIGAVSAISPGLRKKKASTNRSPNMTKDDLMRTGKSRAHYPDYFHVTKHGAVKMHTYFVDPNSL